MTCDVVTAAIGYMADPTVELGLVMLRDVAADPKVATIGQVPGLRFGFKHAAKRQHDAQASLCVVLIGGNLSDLGRTCLAGRFLGLLSPLCQLGDEDEENRYEKHCKRGG